MINIVKKELEFEDELKKKIEFICGFCNTTPTIINGNIRKIDRTNLSYIEPHKVDKLQETLNYFKELWNKFIKFLQDKFFSSNKYDDLIDELQEEEIIDDDDLER